MSIVNKQRINSLVSRQLSSAVEEQAVTLELCELIRRGHGDDVLGTIKDPLKHGTLEIQKKAIALMNRCVLNSGPEFAVLLSTEAWTERLFRVAKTTASDEIRDELIKVVTQWSRIYSTTGLRRCVSRFANSKTLGIPYQKIAAELEAQAQARSRMQRTGGGGGGGASPQPSAVVVNAQPVPQQQQQQQSQRHADPSVMGAVEEFLMAAQGDMAMLEYGLERPDMLDPNVANECRTHKKKAARIVEQYPGLPSNYSDMLVGLLEQLTNDLAIYDALSATVVTAPQQQPPGVSSDSQAASEISARHPSFTGGGDASDVEADSDDDEETKQAKLHMRQGSTAFHSATAQADVAALQIESNTAKLLEEERKEAAELRKQLEDMRQQVDETTLKYKEAKAKNKKAVSMVEDLSKQIDTLETEKEEAVQKGAAPPPPPQIVEKIVEKKPVVSKDVIDGLRSNTSTMKRNLRELKNDTIDLRKDMELQISQISSGITTLVHAAEAERASEGKALQWIQELYKKEMKLRKQYYNTIQDLKGNIRVYCRVRPMSEKELSNGHEDIITYPQEDELRLLDDKGRMKNFEFDKVFTPKASQAQVFEDTMPLIDSVVDGYNVCIFAYGQTGSGKTFTMNGYGDKGINKRALDRLFTCIHERVDSEESTVHCSVLEIYQESIRDLLVPRKESSKQSYDVRTGGQFGHWVTNLSEQEVTSPDDIENIMTTANSNRSEGKTDMNAHSSRSHMIVYILIKTKNKHTGAQTYGKLSLVDLAGSERLDKSGAEGVAAKEAMAINKSLSALGGVISGLSNQAKHVPFRDSQLTYLLQDSMAGQAKVLMFCCVSPASYNTNESLSSLGFATRARGVSLGPVKKNAAH